MILCGQCGAKEPTGALFCSECGNYLLRSEFVASGPPMASTRSMEADGLIATSEERMGDGAAAGQITFAIAASGQRVTVPVGKPIEIGRRDPENDIDPALDLSPFGGIDQGVSRLHAVIRSSDKGHFLVDLDSTNGTLLNDERLEPKTARRLQNGDTIRFGQLLVQVYF